MSRIKTPLSFRKAMASKCQACRSDHGTGEGVCPKPECAWYPFRFGKVYKRPLDRRMKESLVVFDFDAEWDKVVPLLDDPLALRALNAGMTEFCDQIGAEWEPEAGPWCHGEFLTGWIDIADDRFNKSGRMEELNQWCAGRGCPSWEVDPEAHELWHETHGQEVSDKHSDLMDEFLPQPSTPDWYRCRGACHWLASWNCAIGTLLYPDMLWHVVAARNHSTAIGLDDSKALCVDILWGKDLASKIWDTVRDGQWFTLIDEIRRRESRPFRKDAVSSLCGDDSAIEQATPSRLASEPSKMPHLAAKRATDLRAVAAAGEGGAA